MNILPVSMMGDALLITKRAELEDKMNQLKHLSQAEATYLDAIVTEINGRKGLQ